jgi:hypothetical protein
MNSQLNSTLSLSPGEARYLGFGDGELTVLHGRVWLTAAGDEGDTVLSPGQSRRLHAARAVVVEAWDRGQGAVVRWQPRAVQGLRLGGLLAGFLAAFARKAASNASRPQGCM